MMHKSDLAELMALALPTRDVRVVRKEIVEYVSYLAQGHGADSFEAQDALNELDQLIKWLQDARGMLDRVARPYEYEVQRQHQYADPTYLVLVFSRTIATNERIEVERSDYIFDIHTAHEWGAQEVQEHTLDLRIMQEKGERDGKRT